MRLLATLLALLTLWATPVAAQDVPEPPQIPPGEDRIEHVQRGVRAPYEGMLLDMDTAIRWTNQLRWWPETFQLRLLEQQELLEAERNSFRLRLNILDESRTREIEGLRVDLREQAETYERRIARLEDPPFWQTGWFGFVCGVVVVGIGVAVGAIIAVQ